jgi:hypothetical protein
MDVECAAGGVGRVVPRAAGGGRRPPAVPTA